MEAEAIVTMPGGSSTPMKPIPEETLCSATLLPAKVAFTLGQCRPAPAGAGRGCGFFSWGCRTKQGWGAGKESIKLHLCVVVCCRCLLSDLEFNFSLVASLIYTVVFPFMFNDLQLALCTVNIHTLSCAPLRRSQLLEFFVDKSRKTLK